MLSLKVFERQRTHCVTKYQEINFNVTYEEKQETMKKIWAFVVSVIWARVLSSLILRDALFRMRITLGVVLIRFLVCA